MPIGKLIIYNKLNSKFGIQDVTELENLLQTMRGLRFLLERVFSADTTKELLVEGSDLYTYATSELILCEPKLVDYINSKK